MKTISKLKTALLLSTVFASAAFAETPGVTDDTILIGTFGPITGALYTYGKLTMNGMETYFDEVNQAGGIHGRKIELVRVDDQCDPAGAIAAVRKLIHDDKVFAIVGGACSNGVLAAKDDIIEAGIPFLNFAAASNKISDPIEHNIFTSSLTSNLESELQAQYLVDKGVKKVAVIAQHDAWGRDRYETLMPALEEKGIEVVADEELAMESNDSTAQVLRIQSAAPEAVVMLSYPKPASIFLRDASRLGFSSTFVGTSAVADPIEFASQVNIPGATDNFITISPIRYPLGTPEAEPWVEKLTAKYPDDIPHVFNLFGVNAGELTTAVLDAAGEDLTREGFIEAMQAVDGLEVSFAAAPLNCETHQCLRSAAWIQASESGKVEVVGVSQLD